MYFTFQLHLQTFLSFFFFLLTLTTCTCHISPTQLKSLFRKQEEKEAERVSETAASQVGASSSQDWTASSSALRV